MSKLLDFFKAYRWWILAPLLVLTAVILLIIVFSQSGPGESPFRYAIF